MRQGTVRLPRVKRPHLPSKVRGPFNIKEKELGEVLKKLNATDRTTQFTKKKQ